MPIQHLGKQAYINVWELMKTFTNNRTDKTPDELWLVEHPAVFTQGLNGKAEHILVQQAEIEIIKTDRGGQITYHAPGQLIIYVLVDLKRAKLSVRTLVHTLEQAIINFLAELNITASARKDAPGVYIEQQKIASLGLKIRKNKSYHGLALNIDMDLTPFQYINPCGLNNLKITQLKEHCTLPTLESIEKKLCQQIINLLPSASF